MRVGFDARWYNDSGVGTYVAELLKALVPLQGNGFELVIYENASNPVPDLPTNTVKRNNVRSARYSPLSHLEFRKRAREDRLDLFHSPFYAMPFGLSCPVVVTLHDLIPFYFPGRNRLKNFAVKCGYRMAGSRSRAIIAVSANTATDLQRILGVSPEKIAIVHNAASSLHFHSRGSEAEAVEIMKRFGIKAPYVLAASAWNWQTKNLATALRALKLVQQESATQFQTVIYGPPEGIQAVGGAETWKNLNLVQTGHLAAADLAALFRHAQLFLFPSLYEGFGLPILEAMACGCPVITSNAGSLPEVAGNAAQIFEPADAKGMALAITTLLLNPIESAQWRERGLRRAADFSWTRSAQETLSVYHRTLRKS
jgi:glycosyltransferase involved in cell wall biosynthesis